MRAWTARLATLGPVTPLDYPYTLAGRKAPDRQPVLEQAHLLALREAQTRERGIERATAFRADAVEAARRMPVAMGLGRILP